MKRTIRWMTANVLACVLCLGAAVPALAAEAPAEKTTAAAFLREKGIMVGNENGDMMLDSGLTRAQLAAILARVTVNPDHLEAEKAFYIKQCTFTDVPEWARVYVGYCATNYLVAGYGNGLYGPNDPVTSAAACTVMLRCLEGVEADWSYSTACQKAIELGLASTQAVATPEITRGNMAILIYRTMERMGYNIEISEASSSNCLRKTVMVLSTFHQMAADISRRQAMLSVAMTVPTIPSQMSAVMIRICLHLDLLGSFRRRPVSGIASRNWDCPRRRRGTMKKMARTIYLSAMSMNVAECSSR